MGEKRDTERIQILGDLPGEIMVFEPMAIREISHGGAQIDLRFPLQLNSLHEIRLSLGDRSIIVKGRVAHCRIVDVDQDVVIYRAGIEFIEPSDRAQRAIGEFLDLVKKHRLSVE